MEPDTHKLHVRNNRVIRKPELLMSIFSQELYLNCKISEKQRRAEMRGKENDKNLDAICLI